MWMWSRRHREMTGIWDKNALSPTLGSFMAPSALVSVGLCGLLCRTQTGQNRSSAHSSPGWWLRNLSTELSGKWWNTVPAWVTEMTTEGALRFFRRSGEELETPWEMAPLLAASPGSLCTMEKFSCLWKEKLFPLRKYQGNHEKVKVRFTPSPIT